MKTIGTPDPGSGERFPQADDSSYVLAVVGLGIGFIIVILILSAMGAFTE